MNELTLIDVYEKIFGDALLLPDEQVIPSYTRPLLLAFPFITTIGELREFYRSPRLYYSKHPELSDSEVI